MQIIHVRIPPCLILRAFQGVVVGATAFTKCSGCIWGPVQIVIPGGGAKINTPTQTLLSEGTQNFPNNVPPIRGGHGRVCAVLGSIPPREPVTVLCNLGYVTKSCCIRQGGQRVRIEIHRVERFRQVRVSLSVGCQLIHIVDGYSSVVGADGVARKASAGQWEADLCSPLRDWAPMNE